jgi:ribosomal protein S18 acetylase RimI-like enzyme
VVESAKALQGNVVILYRRNTTTARLYSIVVAHAARGRGFGRALLEAGELAARDHSRTRMVLEVREDNYDARTLYQRSGYQHLGCLSNYYQDGATALRLCKLL